MPSDDKPPAPESGTPKRDSGVLPLRMVYACRRCGFNLADWMEYCGRCGLPKGRPG